MVPIYDRRTGQQVGVTGSVRNAIYRNGSIVGFMGPSHTTVKPTTSTTTSTTPRTTSAIPVVGAVTSASTAPRTAASIPVVGQVVQQAQQPTAAQFDPAAYVQQLFQQWTAAQQPATPKTDQQVRDWINKNYGYMAAYINHPEIGPILQQAARDGITGEAELFGRLSGTQWWRTTSASARQWDYLATTDPAEAERRRAETTASIRNRASTLGIDLGGDAGAFTEQALRAGWSDEQITDFLLQRVAGVTDFTEGDLSAMQDQVRQISSQYLVDVSDLTSSAYAKRIASGEMSYDAVASIMRQQAAARFPWMADNLDKGITPQDYFRPLQDQIARLMERTPEDIDPMDPKWLSMMEVVDPKSGERRGATAYEILGSVRGESDYYRTSQANELYANLALGLGQRLGVW